MSNNKEEELVLNDLYDFVLNPNISTSERNIGLSITILRYYLPDSHKIKTYWD